MKRRVNLKAIKLLIASMTILMIMSGCNKKETVAVKIQDGYTETQLSIATGKTVKDILQIAEINIGSEDDIYPSADTKIDKDTEISISRHAKVQIEIGDEAVAVELTGKKVEDALGESKITVDDNDYINHSPKAFLADGMSISVTKRFNVFATVGGKTNQYLTDAKTVEDFLKSQGIELGKKDKVTPKKSTVLEEGIKIVVKKTDIKEEVVKEDISFGTKVEYSDSMDSGTSKVTRAGEKGQKEITYRITYVDGKESGRTVIKEEVIKQPVDQIITKGTKKSGKEIVSKEKIYDCDGSGHGYYIITYADGTIEYEDF